MRPMCADPRCGREMVSVGDRVWECPNDHRADPPTERPPRRFPDLPRTDEAAYGPHRAMRDVYLPNMTAPIVPTDQPVTRSEAVVGRRVPNAPDHEIVAAYERLGAVQLVRDELHVRRETVTRALRRAGVPYGAGPQQNASDEQIREAYARLGAKNAVCKELSVTFRTVKRALNRQEVTS